MRGQSVRLSGIATGDHTGAEEVNKGWVRTALLTWEELLLANLDSIHREGSGIGMQARGKGEVTCREKGG